jgi:hypothetical protein
MTTIVMQGGIWPGTLETAMQYSEYFNVIISTMENENISIEHSAIKVIKSPMPENRGQGNINLQIISSLAGLKACPDDEIVIKTRTDQRITIRALMEMQNIFEQSIVDRQGQVDISFYKDPKMPVWHIFVLGNQANFPFSSQDHLYVGFQKDLLNLFNIPCNAEALTGGWGRKEWGNHIQADKGLNFDVHLRMPIYLGAMYYSKFYPSVKRYIDNWSEYLTDHAPKREEAMCFYNKVKDTVFKTLPKFEGEIWWEKMNCYYPYDMYEPQGEYYAEKQDHN